MQLEKSVSLSPSDARLHFLLGQVYRREGINMATSSTLIWSCDDPFSTSAVCPEFGAVYVGNFRQGPSLRRPWALLDIFLPNAGRGSALCKLATLESKPLSYHRRRSQPTTRKQPVHPDCRPPIKNAAGRLSMRPRSDQNRVSILWSIQTRDELLCGLSVFFIFVAECSQQSRFFDANAVEHRECWWHEGRYHGKPRTRM